MPTAKREEELKEMLPNKEEVLMNEDDLLRGLLEAANYKNDESVRKLIQIKRNGKVFFEFHVRPLQEDEIQDCRRKATKYVPNPYNKNLKVEGDTDYVKVRSYKIYTATIEEDRAKLWDNPKIREQLDVITGADVIEKCLMAGEKDKVSEVIDSISGYGFTLEEYAKN